MADAKDTQTPFLHRWSQRKLAAARESAVERQAPAAPAMPAAPSVPAAAQAPAAQGPASPGVAAPEATQAHVPSLPDVASLNFDSDFSAFLAPKVEEGARRAALRKLFSDPRFNVMDGLDVYIDDYSKFEPIAPDVLAQLEHARYLFDPPKTRVNEHGHVEDVVEAPQARGDAAAEEPQGPPAAAAESSPPGAASAGDVAQGDPALPEPADNAGAATGAGEPPAQARPADAMPPPVVAPADRDEALPVPKSPR